jgi:coatomer subunit beta'
LTGGVLLGVKGQGGIGFYDWQTGGLVRRIEVDPKEVREFLRLLEFC